MQLDSKLVENSTVYEKLKAALLNMDNEHIDDSEFEKDLENEIEKVGQLPVKDAIAEIANKAVTMNLCWDGVHDFLIETFDISTEEIDEILATSGNQAIALAMSRDQKTSAKVLKQLSQSDDELVLNAVAGHSAVEEDVLKELAKSNSEQVRVGVAANSNTPKNILKQLAKDKGEEVIKSLATNPNLEKEEIAQLAQHEKDIVKRYLARNPSCPTEVLEELATTEQPDIVRRLKNRKKKMKENIDDKPEETIV